MKKFIGLVLLVILAACQTQPTSMPPAAGAPAASTSVSITDAPPEESIPSPMPESIPVAVPTSTPAKPSGGAPSDCTDSARFVADVAVQDNDYFEEGQTFKKIWRIQNTGTCAWTSAYTLVFLKGNQMNASPSSTLEDTAPGDVLDIAVNLTAPGTEGTYRADFEIHTPSGAAMPIDQDTRLWVIIRVNTYESISYNPSSSTTTSASGGAGFADATCAYTTDPARVNETFAALNAYRARQGKPPYTLNAQLTQAAQAHAEDMACNNLFYHNGSNGSTPKSRVAASGYVASAVTENVYGSYPPLSPADVIVWWANDINDPRHNENLLSTRYIEVGIGYAFFNNFGYYVIDFAIP